MTDRECNGAVGGSQGYVYLLRCGWFYKIGISADVKARVASLQTASPFKIELMLYFMCDCPRAVEQGLHRKYAEHRTNGEWFEFDANVIKEITDTFNAYNHLPGIRHLDDIFTDVHAYEELYGDVHYKPDWVYSESEGSYCFEGFYCYWNEQCQSFVYEGVALTPRELEGLLWSRHHFD